MVSAIYDMAIADPGNPAIFGDKRKIAIRWKVARECVLELRFKGQKTFFLRQIRIDNTQMGYQCMWFPEWQVLRLSNLVILVHQQFWYMFGWFLGTQRVSKLMVLKMASSGLFTNLAILAPAILVHVWVVPEGAM